MTTIRDTSAEAVDGRIRDAFLRGYRIRVQDVETGEIRTGTVSRSMGVQPVFLLMHRSNQTGSSDILSSRDRVLAVKFRDSRGYISTGRAAVDRSDV